MTQELAVRETREVVVEYIKQLGAGDYAAVADLFADQIDWRLSWPDEALNAAIPWIRMRHTREDIQQHYRCIAEHNAPHGAGTAIERIIVDGADAVLLGTIRNIVLRSGMAYNAHFALHLTVENGLISRHHVYEDSLAVAQAWHVAEGASEV